MKAVAVRNFSHVSVYVTDLERSLPFYRDALGLVRSGCGLIRPTPPGRSARICGPARSPR